jgi:hypothetical protein
MSSASAASQSSCRRPPSLSTSSEEPTFTTMRRKSASEGALRDMRGLGVTGGATTIVTPPRCLAHVPENWEPVFPQGHALSQGL